MLKDIITALNNSNYLHDYIDQLVEQYGKHIKHNLICNGWGYHEYNTTLSTTDKYIHIKGVLSKYSCGGEDYMDYELKIPIEFAEKVIKSCHSDYCDRMVIWLRQCNYTVVKIEDDAYMFDNGNICGKFAGINNKVIPQLQRRITATLVSSTISSHIPDSHIIMNMPDDFNYTQFKIELDELNKHNMDYNYTREI